MRLLTTLMITAALLAGCAPRIQEDRRPLPMPELPAGAVGTWDFWMWDEHGNVTDGRMTIEADGTGRMQIPQQGLDAAVDGQLQLEGHSFIWRGSLATEMGRFPFVLTGEAGSEEMTGENEAEGFGTLQVSAQRVSTD